MTNGRRSRHRRLHHLTRHVGQALVAAGVAEGQLLVIEAQQVQDRRVEVVDDDRVLHRVQAELVGRADRRVRPSTPPPASHIV